MCTKHRPVGGSVGIGRLNETSLHAALKEWVLDVAARGGGKADAVAETVVDGYVVDVRLDDELVEIQTGSFSSIQKKLRRLIDGNRVRVLYPIAAVNRITRISTTGEVLSSRRSPKRGRVEDLFGQLVYFTTIVPHRNLTLEVALIEQQEIRREDGKGSRRRKGVSIVDKQLLSVLQTHRFVTASDYASLLPEGLLGDAGDDGFTNSDLRAATGLRPRRSQQMTYCLRKMGVLEPTGKRGREQRYHVRRDFIRRAETSIVGKPSPGSSGDRATAS